MRETAFADDPVAVAARWQSLGAMRLHIVDLDGAQVGHPVNERAIAQIIGLVDIPVQVGGGLRTLEDIEKLLNLGAQRVILGTAAVKDTKLVRESCRLFADAVVVSLDSWDGCLSVSGWQERTDLTAVEVAKALMQLGVKRFIYTDISRDGTLTEPNFNAIFELVSAIKYPVITSGGITTLSHLKLLRQLGVEGAIVGRALYTGDINLKDAISVVG